MDRFARILLVSVGLFGVLALGGGCSENVSPQETEQPRAAREPQAPSKPVTERPKREPVVDAGYRVARLTKQPRPAYELQSADHVESIAGEPDSDEMTMVFVGDIMLGYGMQQYFWKHGYNYPFESTAPLLRQADLAIGNLEGSVVDRADGTKGRYTQKMASAPLEGLVWAGFDAVSLGNNHVHDTGDEGLRETIENIERAGIGVFGAGASENEARAPWVVETRGLRVAVLGGVSTGMLMDPDWLGNKTTTAQRRKLLIDDLTHAGGVIDMGTFLHTPETLAADVAAARSRADLVVVYLHMGVVNYRPPYVDQMRLAEAAANAGADLIVGHHAHIWQPVALIDGTPVVYGVGNFAFALGGQSADEGLIVRAVVSTETRRLTRVELFPLATWNAATRFRPQLLAGDSARIALEDLRTWSETFFSTRPQVLADRAVIDLTRIR